MAYPLIRPQAHHERDPDFNAKAPHYKTANFSDLARRVWPHLPDACVRVVFDGYRQNVGFKEEEPLFRVYATMDDESFIGHYFARALKEFGL